MKVVKKRKECRGLSQMSSLSATTNKVLSTRTKEKQTTGSTLPMLQDILLVGCVATALIGYLIACVYSLFHPLVVPLPDYKGMYTAYDMSNVSVNIVNPVENSQVTPQGILFEWEFANFPVEALRLYGAEVFRYKVSLDDKVITSELGFLALQEEGNEELVHTDAEVLNRTVRFPIPLRKFTGDDGGVMKDSFKLHLEVTIPIPGLLEELKTYEKVVSVQKLPAPSPEDGVQLTLTSPLDGATFQLGQSIVLEYIAVNVHKIEVLVDGRIYIKKTHVNDGNMLLRGLGVGPHKFELRAVDERSVILASSAVHVDIIEHA